MGALTLKSFPFILRSWSVKSYESFDPTDSFGTPTRVFVNKNQLVKIEPQFSNTSAHSWLPDKGRLFFDSMFGTNSESRGFPTNTSRHWEKLFKQISKIFYVSNMCNFRYFDRCFFVIVFENISLEILNFLAIISQINSFVKLRRAEKLTVDPSLESGFQLNAATSQKKLSFSSLGLLINVNSRYEGPSLNLMLRQRYFKGNFQLFAVGSLLDFTYPVSFLGSNISILKEISEGNHVFCKNFANSKNPVFVTNFISLSRGNAQELLNILKVLKYSTELNEVWDGSNALSPSLPDAGVYYSFRFGVLTFKDLLSFNSIYTINVCLDRVTNLRVLMESRLLRFKNSSGFSNYTSFLEQNYKASFLTFFKFLKFKNFVYLPNNTFFENQELFVNTEGSKKIGSKLINRKNTKNNWQLLRKFVHSSVTTNSVSCVKDSRMLFFYKSSLFDFKNFSHFHFQVAKSLTSLNEYLVTENSKFVLYKKFAVFKNVTIKSLNTKLKYWLDDFYTGGKDAFCRSSLSLIHCSGSFKLRTTNFF